MTTLLSIPALQDHLMSWEREKPSWLFDTGTSFVDHYNVELAQKVIEEKKKLNQNKTQKS